MVGWSEPERVDLQARRLLPVWPSREHMAPKLRALIDVLVEKREILALA